MTGDVQRRFCPECGCHVHDFSRMTRKEVGRLLKVSTGRVCGRITRDEHGRVIYARERNQFNRLVQISLFGLATHAVGCELQVKVLDEGNAAIAYAQVEIRNSAGSTLAKGRTDGTGLLKQEVPSGKYSLTVTSPGFEAVVKSDVSCVDSKAAAPIEVKLPVAASTMGGLVITESPNTFWDRMRAHAQNLKFRLTHRV